MPTEVDVVGFWGSWVLQTGHWILDPFDPKVGRRSDLDCVSLNVKS